MKKHLKSASLSILAVLTAVTVLIGCQGCKTTLAPGGVYQGDTFLYNMDETIVQSKGALQRFIKWEYDNRATITNTWPQVTIAADKIRAEAPAAYALAGLARTSYIQVKSALSPPIVVTSAETAFRDSVEAIGQKVADANVASKTTTLSNKPDLTITVSPVPMPSLAAPK